MEMKYNPEDFAYPLNEDMQRVYDAKVVCDNDPDDKLKYIRLSSAIYDLTLTMKALCVEGRLRPDIRDELSTYFWGFLL